MHTAYNGIEALDLLKGNNKIPIPDIIVLDLNMPKMNGGEFLTELRKDNTFNNVKIFIMTTSNDDRDRSRGSEFGVTGYIIKPLNFNENTKRNVSMDNFMHFQIMKMVGGQLN
ncbi:MAG: response regulator [Sporocytophaga sp.]|nr:response regulator [Sporocytophaga sp.]